MPRLKYEKLADESVAESSEKIQKRVSAARQVQQKRFKKANAEMSPRELKIYCQLDTPSKNLLRLATSQFHLSARQYSRIIKVARTIADLEKSENITSKHIAEALQYRPKEQNMY